MKFHTEMIALLFLHALTWICVQTKDNNADNVCTSDQCIYTATIFKQNMNTAVLPCHNFYEFMCGNYKKWNPLYPGSPGRFMILSRHIYINQMVRMFLTMDRKPSFPVSLEKAKTVYFSCMDKQSIEKFGDIPIPLELNTIGLPITPPFNLPMNKPLNFSKLLAKIHRSPFTRFLFDVSVAEDVEDSTKTRLVFNYSPSIHHLMATESENPETFRIRSRLSETELQRKKEQDRMILLQVISVAVQYMKDLTDATSSKKTNQLVVKRIIKVVDFLMKLEETKELENVEDGHDHDDPTYITLDELQRETDKILGHENAQIQINWYDYVKVLFEDIHNDTFQFFKSGELIVLKNMEQFKAVLRVLSKVSQKVLVSTIWWLVVDSVSPFATARFRTLHYEYKTRIGKRPTLPGPWECNELVKSQFSNLFAHLLIQINKNAFKEREEVHEMVSNIRDAYEESITKATWLDDATKMAALNKLKSITQNISFSDWIVYPEMIDARYKEVVVSRDLFYLNSRSAKLAGRKKELEFLGKKIAVSGEMTSLHLLNINASYTPCRNSIDVPLGILGPPYYGLGLHHEIGHAFDDLGNKFNSEGKKKSWWKKKTIARYAERSKCFIDFFSNIYFPEVNGKVNGKATLDENIADFLGVQQALKAYRKYVAKHGKEKYLSNFEHVSHEKLLTMAFATINCSEIAPSILKYILEKDDHAPNKARVLGVLKNSYEFAEIWKCSTDSEMNPEKKCVIW